MFSSNNPVIVYLNLIAGALTVVASFFTRIRTRLLWTLVSTIVLWLTAHLYEPKKIITPLPPEPPAPLTIDALNLFHTAGRLGDGGRWAEAVSVYRSLENIAPKFPGVHFQIASCLRMTGDFDGGIHEATLAREEASAGRSGQIHVGDVDYVLAVLLFLNHRWAEAQRTLEQAVVEGFPYGCDITSDSDLKLMDSDPYLQPSVRAITSHGMRSCASAP